MHQPTDKKPLSGTPQPILGAGKGSIRRRKKLLMPLIALSAAGLLFVILLLLAFTNLRYRIADLLDNRPKPKPEVVEKVVEKVVTKEVFVPKYEVPLSWNNEPAVSVNKIWGGIKIQTTLEKTPGGLSSEVRSDDNSFMMEFKARVTWPKPAKTLEEVSVVNPLLPSLLPSLGTMLKGARVSEFYWTLLDTKEIYLQKRIRNLNSAMTKHNLFDCQTILEFTHKESGQRLMLMQADMDVVSDGSDGDRMDHLPRSITSSAHYQATTSYAWPKKTKKPNPMLPIIEAELKDYRAQLKTTSGASDKATLKRRIQSRERSLAELKSRSFLIAQEDPFMVIPLSMLKKRAVNPFTPMVGDYVVVIFENTIYPAIVGDFGPYEKVGEASLRLAKQINNRSSPNSRPVSSLEVTYLVFTNSREASNGPPNLKRWHDKCKALLEKVGGVGKDAVIHQWEDRLKTASAAP